MSGVSCGIACECIRHARTVAITHGQSRCAYIMYSAESTSNACSDSKEQRVLGADSPFLRTSRQEAKSSGLVATPDVLATSAAAEREFIILATDGLWDVLGDQVISRLFPNATAVTFVSRVVHKTLRRHCKSFSQP